MQWLLLQVATGGYPGSHPVNRWLSAAIIVVVVALLARPIYRRLRSGR